MSDKLTFTMENYLEAVYELSAGGKGARLTDIAERLGVTKASTHKAMDALAQKGLITSVRYQDIFLTEEGARLAEFTSQKHHLIYRFFTEVLKIDSVIADRDACAIEHVISVESVMAMQGYLCRVQPESCEPVEQQRIHGKETS